MESEVDKKHKERYKKMKAHAKDFLQHQTEGMEMMAEVSRGVYEILEKLTADEINKNPIAFIRRESTLLKKSNSLKFGLMTPGGSGGDIDEFKDAYDGTTAQPQPQNESANVLFTQDVIDEFDEVFHDAHDNYVKKLNQLRITTMFMNPIFEEEEKEANTDNQLIQ